MSAGQPFPSILAVLIVTFSILFGGVAKANNVDNDESCSNSNSNINHQCRLYLAPSSTSTDKTPKLGIFAGVDFDPDVMIGYYDIVIPILDLAINNGKPVDDDDDDDDDSGDFASLDFLKGFLWNGDDKGAGHEAEDVVVAVPGHGTLIGTHPVMINSKWDFEPLLFRTASAGGERSGVSHPGRGAYTSYYNMSLKSSERIPAGMEIFIDHGKDEVDQDYKTTYTQEDHANANAVLEKIREFMNRYNGEMNDSLKRDIYNFIINSVLEAGAGENYEKIRALLPSDPDELEHIHEMGGRLPYIYPDAHKDLEWLQAHGQCLDNIRPGPSTIPDAGRGAFATRPIQRGELVSPAPLIQISDEKLLDIYEFVTYTEEDEDGDEVTRTEREHLVGKQLLLNYCFGHPESSLLLYPVGHVTNLINHRAGDQANAKIVWSSSESHQTDWYDLQPKDFGDAENQFIGLMFDIIATRDIDADEEIFIDYGPDWVEAWETHVESWMEKVENSEIDKTWPLKALDLNEQYRNKPFKTPEERAKEPYPEDVMTVCFIIPGDEEEEQDVAAIIHWTGNMSQDIMGSMMHGCDIRTRKKVKGEEKEDDTYVYAAIVQIGGNEVIVVQDIPHRAIMFVDEPYTSDQHLEDAFRHYIGIPDELFPQAWRDKRYQVD